MWLTFNKQIITAFLILLNLMLFSMIIPMVCSEKTSVYDNIVITQSEDINPIISYKYWNEWYQDYYYDIFLHPKLIKGMLGDQEEFGSIELVCQNGHVEPDYRVKSHYSRVEKSDGIGWRTNNMDLEPTYEFEMKPREFDYNYYLNLTLTLFINNTVIYEENHKFWIIGEPIIEKGVDVSDNYQFLLTYVIASGWSILLGILIVISYEFDKARRGKGRK